MVISSAANLTLHPNFEDFSESILTTVNLVLSQNIRDPRMLGTQMVREGDVHLHFRMWRCGDPHWQTLSPTLSRSGGGLVFWFAAGSFLD